MRYDYCCSYCGSSDLVFTTTATWDFKTQTMQVTDAKDEAQCMGCGRDLSGSGIVEKTFEVEG